MEAKCIIEIKIIEKNIPNLICNEPMMEELTTEKPAPKTQQRKVYRRCDLQTRMACSWARPSLRGWPSAEALPSMRENNPVYTHEHCPGMLGHGLGACPYGSPHPAW